MWQVQATHFMCLEGMVSKGVTDLQAARVLASRVCIDLFSSASLSVALGGSESSNRGILGDQAGQQGSLWGAQTLHRLLSLSFSVHVDRDCDGKERASGERQEGGRGRLRAVQEVALGMVRLLRGAAQLLMMSEADAATLRDLELQRQDQEQADLAQEAAEAWEAEQEGAGKKTAQARRAKPPRGIGVLPLKDLYCMGASWAALGGGGVRNDGRWEQKADGGQGEAVDGEAERNLIAHGVQVINEMMRGVVESLPLATEYMLHFGGMGRARTSEWARFGRSSILLHLEMLSLAACYHDAAAAGEANGKMAKEERSDVILSSFALAKALGPGDETMVLRLVDGILLPHLCAPSVLSRALSKEQIFHLGGKDSAEASQAIRDYYLHWLKRLLTSEGEGVLPLSIASWTQHHDGMQTMMRPVRSAALPLSPDFLFLPLSIALKAVSENADTHLATPEFCRASAMTLALAHVLLFHSGRMGDQSGSAGRGGLGKATRMDRVLMLLEGSVEGEKEDSARQGKEESGRGGEEAVLCRCASVYLLRSDVYLHDTVASFLRSALGALLRPCWLDKGTMGLDLSQKCIEHLQMGKLFATLASQFTQDSFGESSLSQILLMSLQPRLDPAWRLEVGLCVYLLCVCVCVHLLACVHARAFQMLQGRGV